MPILDNAQGLAQGAYGLDTGLFTPDQYDAPYTLFESRNRYIYQSGLEMMPVAAAPASTGAQQPRARVVRLAAPFGFRVFTWAACRLGKKPKLPDPAVQDSANEVLLYAEICPSPPELDSSASVHVYFAEGCYVYGLLVPLLNQNPLRMGTTPYDRTSDGDNYYGPQDFQPLQ